MATVGKALHTALTRSYRALGRVKQTTRYTHTLPRWMPTVYQAFSTKSGPQGGDTEHDKVEQLLTNLARLGETNKGLAVFHKAQSQGLPLTVDAYNAIFSLASQGTREEALQVYNELYPQMLDAGIKPNALTYALLVQVLERRVTADGPYMPEFSKRVALEQAAELCDRILADKSLYDKDAKPLGELDPWGRQTQLGFRWLLKTTAIRRTTAEAHKGFRCMQLLGISPDESSYDNLRLSATFNWEERGFPRFHDKIPEVRQYNMPSQDVLNSTLIVSPSHMITNHPTSVGHGFELGGYEMRTVQLKAQKIEEERQDVWAEIERLRGLGYVSERDNIVIESGALRWAQPDIIRNFRDRLIAAIDPTELDVQAEFDRVHSERKLLAAPRDPRKTKWEF